MKKQSVWENCSMLADKNTSATSFVLSVAEVRNSQCLVDSLVNAKPCVCLGCMGDSISAVRPEKIWDRNNSSRELRNRSSGILTRSCNADSSQTRRDMSTPAGAIAVFKRGIERTCIPEFFF